MIDAGSRSRALFGSGFYCAESVVMAVAEALDVRCNLIPAMATGFCSGLARTAGPCGALTGAVLSAGVVLGRRSPDAPLEACYQAVQEVREGFIARFGSDNCQALTGCHLGTPEGQAAFRERGVHEECLEYVAGAAELALEAIARHRPAD